MKTIKILCPAKINLFLSVLSKRDDGYHNIETLMHKVSLFDELIIKVKCSTSSIISFNCDIDNISDKSNLVYKAAAMYLEKCQKCYEININLKKNIPVSAGLAGGSSDAAGLLFGLDLLIGEVDNNNIKKMASELGSDVLFCYSSVCAVCRGTGDIITETSPMTFLKGMVISIGKKRVSTQYAYSLVKLTPEKRIDKTLFFESEICKKMFNSFEEVISDKIDEINYQKNILDSNGSIRSMMSGSGPSVYGIFDNETKLKSAYCELIANGYNAFIVYPETKRFNYELI